MHLQRLENRALAFRDTRHQRFPEAAESERMDELREGLAQYTGTVGAADSLSGAVESAIRQLAEAEDAATFVRTFAYASGPAYGLLLDDLSPGWTRAILPTANLGRMVMDAAGIAPLQDAAAIETAAERYGGDELRSAEEFRESEQQARVTELRRRFVENPQVIVPKGSGAMLLTTGATPIPGEGTVFFEYRVTSEWGSLESNGGILESSDGETLRLPAPFETEGNVLVGDSWQITLSPGWVVRDGSRPGDFKTVSESE